MNREGYHQAPNRLRTWSYEDRGLAKPRRIDRETWRTAEERARIMETARDVVAAGITSGLIRGKVFEKHARTIASQALEKGWAWFKGEDHE